MRDREIRRPASHPSHADEQLANALGAIANLNDNLQQLHAGVKTSNAIRRQGLETRQLPAGGVSGKLSNSAGRLAGWSFRETTGSSAAVVRLRDGFDASGDLLITIGLNASESTRDWPPAGIAFGTGLFLEVVSGSIEGAVQLGNSAL